MDSGQKLMMLDSDRLMSRDMVFVDPLIPIRAMLLDQV